eukprot:14383730-Alexandrium_andersonii.AAC.1
MKFNMKHSIRNANSQRDTSYGLQCAIGGGVVKPSRTQGPPALPPAGRLQLAARGRRQGPAHVISSVSVGAHPR